ncbi:MAG: pyruvate kinase, partial [Deltaproteobacteria bacterium]|nr:pyruvate kinase [Deltaproteobacteria bacterium]
SVDGVMIARGDLGVEMPLEEVPIIQKRLIRRARLSGKSVITATQMLRSMVDSPRPTRAEAADVANAILDGTDAVMLSEETAVGSYPVSAVQVMDRIGSYTETEMKTIDLPTETLPSQPSSTEQSISRAAHGLACDLNAKAIIATTTSGSTPRLVSRFRPHCPIIGITYDPLVVRQLTLSWGVIPLLVDKYDNTDEMLNISRQWTKDMGLAGPGDKLVVTAGVPVGVPGTTNMVKVIELD